MPRPLKNVISLSLEESEYYVLNVVCMFVSCFVEFNDIEKFKKNLMQYMISYFAFIIIIIIITGLFGI